MMRASGWPSASETRIVSAASRTAMRRASAFASSSADRIPPTAETGLSIVLFTILDQRSCSRSSTGSAGQTFASTSVTRRAFDPAGAPYSPTYTPGSVVEEALLTDPDACTRPGSRNEPLTSMTPPTVRSAPTSGAIHSSLMLFCIETRNPSSANHGLITASASSVSYDFTQRNRRSTCSDNSCGAMATGAACSSPPPSVCIVRPRVCIASRCVSHGSTTSGSRPTLASRTAICPPIAPAP